LIVVKSISMIDSEKLELAIYRFVSSLGVARSASISDFVNTPGSGGEFALIVQRLQDLLMRHCIGLYKYIGDSRISYEKVVNVEGVNTFFSGHFVIEIEPGGRKFFEKLEEQDLQAKQSRSVFIGCGQYSAKEKALGKDLAKAVDELTPCKGYFAEDQNSADNLSRHIFKAIDECAGFVAVLHHRGGVELGAERHIRASVWIEQEIAIASFLTQFRKRVFPVLCYIQNGLKIEGVRTLLLTNGNTFNEEAQVLKDFRERLKSGTFKPVIEI
jgi:hypothetical protein